MDNRKNVLFSILIVLVIIAIVLIVANSSFAYEYKNDNYMLFYKDDNVELENDIKLYLSRIDDYLIPNSSYLYSDILVDNYDFLTNFALDYIINNREVYYDKIVELDNYVYYDINYKEKNTKKYIDIEEIYKITDKYFGIRDYSIINDNINIKNNYISLSDYTDRLFSLDIINVDVSFNDNTVIAIVTYDSLDKYKYTFKNINNVLKIYNIEVAYGE